MSTLTLDQAHALLLTKHVNLWYPAISLGLDETMVKDLAALPDVESRVENLGYKELQLRWVISKPGPEMKKVSKSNQP